MKKNILLSGVTLIIISLLSYFLLNNKADPTEGEWWGYSCEKMEDAAKSICLTSGAKGLVATKGLLSAEEIIFTSALKKRSGVRENCHSITHSVATAYFKDRHRKSDLGMIRYFCQGGILHGALSVIGEKVNYNEYKSLVKNLCDSYREKEVVLFDCRHGVGHGLGAYDKRGLLYETLNLCKDFFSTDDGKFDCATGAMSSLSNNLKRDEIDLKRWRDVGCSQLAESYYRSACFRRLPEILYKIGVKLDTIKDICSTSGELKDCSYGYGWLFADTDPGHSCQGAPLDERSCLAGAIFSLAGRDQIAGKKSDICLNTKKENLEWCKGELDRIDRYEITLPETESLGLIKRYM